jgi:hypothetical protein
MCLFTVAGIEITFGRWERQVCDQTIPIVVVKVFIVLTENGR